MNYLGPYLLTRRLEGRLAASAPARVVNLSSIMHRMGRVGRLPEDWMRSWRHGSHYPSTKLANVLFTYECERRLGPLGVQVSAPLLLGSCPCRAVGFDARACSLC